MTMADLGALAALLSLPVTVLAAWWARRGDERATDAVLSTGHGQAAASLTAVRLQGELQGEGERERWHRAQLHDAATVFLRAVDAFVRTVRALPGVAHDRRQALLDEHARAVDDAFAAVELTAPARLLPLAEQVRARCRALERRALDRAVLRCALAALEEGWCQGDDSPETCTDERHGSAWVAWDLLSTWADRTDEERRADRDLLDFCLRDSGALSDEQADLALALADRCPTGWDRLVGGLVRDPLLDDAAAVRAAFVGPVRSETLPATEVNSR
ncbi:hypothetical protein [Streptomyces sp. G45]|uniref:hypothetical protein n=1 Tax=Streptomyces sp. G45 TaxID=3406627 RepID=UPI003C2228B4